MFLALAFMPEVLLKGLAFERAKTMFVLQPKPTFDAFISIPVPGAPEAKIKFKFKRLGKKALRELFKNLQEEGSEREDVDTLLEIVEGWYDVDTAFNKEALELLCDAYPGATMAIILGYNKEMVEGKAKN